MTIVQQSDRDDLRAHLNITLTEVDNDTADTYITSALAVMTRLFENGIFEYDQSNTELLEVQKQAEIRLSAHYYYDNLLTLHTTKNLHTDENYGGDIQIGDTQIDDNQYNAQARLNLIKDLKQAQYDEYNKYMRVLINETGQAKINCRFG